MHLHLLDGTYELFRNYFGAPKRRHGEVEVGAVQGLMASTLSLLQDGGVTHLGAAFDTVIRSFRNDLFPGYKTDAGVPADLLAQFPIAEDGLEAIGVVVWRMTTYEADDALATAAAHALGAMALPEASAALTAAKPSDAMKATVADATLACAEKLLAAGNKAAALKAYQSLLAASPSEPIREAAARGAQACGGA